MDAGLDADLATVEATQPGVPYRRLIGAGRLGYIAIVRAKAAAIKAGTWPPPPGPPVVDRFGTCVHLGPPLAGPDGRGVVRECRSCSGSVRLKVFACHHPAHEDTDALRCRACGDYHPGGG